MKKRHLAMALFCFGRIKKRVFFRFLLLLLQPMTLFWLKGLLLKQGNSPFSSPLSERDLCTNGQRSQESNKKAKSSIKIFLYIINKPIF
ncbi:hypothetical protein BREVNS_0935 [Brevinematales bacterium NS]|nr:hypothetical protein BREVNS_0935 [Brevinematales bacterium NS]